MNWAIPLLEELLPVVVFFVVQQQTTFQTGLIAMVGTLGALLVLALLRGKTIPRFAVVSTLAFLLFAIPSIVSGDSYYFQLSDTLLDGALALMLLGTWWYQVPILKTFFGRIFAITDQAWLTLSFRWGVFFLMFAALNEYVRLGYSEETWALFKLIATFAVLCFGCYQFTLSARERIPEESNWLGLRE